MSVCVRPDPYICVSDTAHDALPHIRSVTVSWCCGKYRTCHYTFYGNHDSRSPTAKVTKMRLNLSIGIAYSAQKHPQFSKQLKLFFRLTLFLVLLTRCKFLARDPSHCHRPTAEKVLFVLGERCGDWCGVHSPPQRQKGPLMLGFALPETDPLYPPEQEARCDRSGRSVVLVVWGPGVCCADS